MSSDARRARIRPWRIAAPWLIVGLLLVSTAVVASAAPAGTIRVGPSVGVAHVVPSASTNLTVNITLNDTPAFVPNALSVSAGTSVTFNLTNVGNFSHSFTLAKQANVTLPTSWSPAQLDAYFAKNGSLVNTTLTAGASARATVNFTGSLGNGKFEFVSIVPYQFQAGMYGFVTVIPHAGGNVSTSVNTTDSLTFVPQYVDVATTSTMTFPINVQVEVINQGSLQHTFTLSRLSNVTVSIANYTTYFAQNPPLANVTVPTGSGSFVYANFTINAPGVYMFICEQPGHFAAGMDGYLYVDVPVPHVSSPSTAVVLTWVLVVGASIVGVGVILAVIAAYTGRFPPKAKEPESYH